MVMRLGLARENWKQAEHKNQAGEKAEKLESHGNGIVEVNVWIKSRGKKERLNETITSACKY